jgi:hypothetical protein
MPGPTTLTDVRINVKDLLSQITALKNTRIDIILHHSSADEAHEEKRSTTLSLLLQSVCLFLARIFSKYPKMMERSIPDLWINGHGTLLHATFPATASSPTVTSENEGAVSDVKVRKRLYDQHMQFVLSLWWDDYIDGITRSPSSCS